MVGESSVISCVELTMNLFTPIDLDGVISDKDVEGGVVRDPHITVFFGGKSYVPSEEVIPFLERVCPSEVSRIKTLCEKDQWFGDRVLDNFYLSNFENDTDSLVLKLKKDNQLFEDLSAINKTMRSKYGLHTEFRNYVPHVSLANLKKGESKKYLNNSTLYNVLQDSFIKPDDFAVSYTNHEDVETIVNLTSYNAVDRYFRLFNQEESRKEVMKMRKESLKNENQ